MKVLGLSVLCAVLLASCVLVDRNGDGVVKVACLGDSNTAANVAPSWCTKLAVALPGAVLINRAWGGTSALPGGPYPTADAEQQLNWALFQWADVVVFAFGTNDLRLLNATPAALAGRLHDLAAMAEAAHVIAFVATVAPNYYDPGFDVLVADVNARLRADPALRIVDFDTNFGPELFLPNNIHLNSAGQELRAARALIALAVN